MTKPLSSYGKVRPFNDPDLEGLLEEPCYIQEKIDGSQFSFTVTPENNLITRSRGAILNLQQPQKLFLPAICTVKALYEANRLPTGLIFRGEAVSTPRHNKLDYQVVPPGNIVLYDVYDSQSNKELHNSEVAKWAKTFNLLYAPILKTYENPKIDLSIEILKNLVTSTTSCINPSVSVEGVVIKRCNSTFMDKTGEIGRAKYVSEDFQELQNTKKSIAENQFTDLAPIFAPEPRKYKLIQRLKESGEWTGTMKDMAKMVPMLIEDVEQECMEELKNMVYLAVRKKVRQGIQTGLAQWYKEKLMEKAFD